MTNNNKLQYSAALLFFISLNFTNNVYANDSSEIGPIMPKPGKGSGFVLVRGEGKNIFCKEGKIITNCSLQVSNRTCPAGYKPSALVTATGNGFSKYSACSLRGYFIDHGLPVENEFGGYSLNFYNAYARFATKLCADHAISIAYAVYCL